MSYYTDKLTDLREELITQRQLLPSDTGVPRIDAHRASLSKRVVDISVRLANMEAQKDYEAAREVV